MSDLQSEPTMASSDSVGPYLKKRREAQGLSLDQVASLTRIQSKFLRAIEDEEFHVLPEQVFTRGFVRTYARSLNISEEDALRRFSESSSEFYQQGQQAQQQAQIEIQEEKRGKLNRNLVVIIIVVIIVALAFLLPKQQQSSPPPPSPNIENINSDPVPTPVPSTEIAETQPEDKTELTSLPLESEESPLGNQPPQPEVTPPSPEAVSSPSPETVLSPTPETPEPPKPVTAISTDPLRLEIEASQLTWVVVKSDSDSPKEALLQPGQQASWEAQQQFTLTLGNAAGAVVKLNGEPRGPFGKPGQVVREVVLKP